MVSLARKLKEAVGAVDNLSKFEKFSKLKASYVEHDKFTNSNLRRGYFVITVFIGLTQKEGNVCWLKMMVPYAG
jgi:hypothetical protein